MGVTKSIEHVTVVMGTNTLVQQDLTAGQDETACIPIISCYITTGSGDNYDWLMPDVYFDDNAGTARLNVQRKTGTDGLVVQVSIWELDTTKVNVQQGTISLSDTQTNNTATITAVTLAKAFAFHTMREGTTQSADPNGTDDYVTDIAFNSTTQIQVTREHGLGSMGDLTGHYYIVECIGTEFAVQTASPSLALSATSANATITAVDLAKTFLITGLQPAEGGPAARDMAAWAHLSSTTNVNLSRDGGGTISGAITSTIFVVECANTEWDVQRFQPNFTSSETTDNTTITATVIADTAIIPGAPGHVPVNHQNDTLNREDGMVILDQTTTTNVRVRRNATNSDAGYYKFEVVEFEIDAAGGGRIMSSLAGAGGLAGHGGIAGPGGGLAGAPVMEAANDDFREAA